ncbi:hypothetical protein C8035_v009424 [Colletotrichum spinosum]|uniref:Uncharacterized protein n=1 Tax=Colletotrichum spinosum TaxID=1347390 RepID=A0A4R8QAB5_9PEZI|nr:hypothetical protein C8035_v009424 [Colletotrichum spinosum]
MAIGPARQAREKYEAHQKNVRAGAEERIAQEKDTTRGEKVWFSRSVRNGNLHHWAVITHNTRYEVRRSDDSVAFGSPPASKDDGSPPNPMTFETKSSPGSLKDEMTIMKQENSKTRGKIRDQDYYICLIGWTDLTKPQVDDEYHAAGHPFDALKLDFGDCQALLGTFAGKILKEKEGTALDYHMFARNVETEHGRLREIRPDEAMKAFHAHQQLTTGIATGAMVGAGAGYLAYESERPMDAGGAAGVSGSGAAPAVTPCDCGYCLYCGFCDCDWSACAFACCTCG